DGYFAKGTKPVFATKDGFLRHFVAWIINDDLPWTTGETPGIVRLFQFLEVRWTLPSGTTVQHGSKNLHRALCQFSEGTNSEQCTLIQAQISMVFTFAGTIASFINDDWELCEHLVDFHHIKDKEHEGI
ncbi:hypothetical protein BDR07DRAFT_1185587, partial [Suillus spraguei]